MRWSELPGRRFGPYEMLSEVGIGGTSRVFRAFDHNQLREVAFKIIPNDADDRVAFIQRFNRETAIVRKLNHTNIVPIYDAGETEEFVYQAMRLVVGTTLRHRAMERMGAQEAARYMIQAARALHHAHTLGIVHRDVKPSNMLIPDDEPERLLLTDFGTAKILGARGPTKTGATIGTPEYMSPEQAEGREVDQRTDIYSLGCTLYEALAGRPPFIGSTPVSILYQQVHAQPTYIRSYNSTVPRELWNVLRICLAKRPEERYPSAERLAEDLLPFAEGLIQPTPAPWRAPVTGRLFDMPDRPTNRTLRTQTSGPLMQGEGGPHATPSTLSGAPLPPPFTPSASPIVPAQPSQPIPPVDRAPGGQPGYDPRQQPPLDRAPGSQPRYGMPQQRVTGRPRQSDGAGSGLLNSQGAYGQGQYGAGSPPPGRGPVRTSGPLSGQPSYAPGRGPAGPSGPLPGAGGYGSRGVTSNPLSGRLTSSRQGVASGPLSDMPGGPRQGVTSGPISGIPGGPRQGVTSGPISGIPGGPRQGVTSGPLRAPNTQPPVSYRGPASGSIRSSTSAPMYRAPVSTMSYRGAPSVPMRGPTSGYGARADVASAPRQGSTRRVAPLWLRSSWGMLVAGLVAVLLLGGALALGAAGMGLLPGATQAHPKVKALPTATAIPTATLTPAQPTATAGPSAQQLLDRQAAAAFQNIVISPYAGLACSPSSQTTQFKSYEVVYAHLCTSGSGVPGPVSVVVRSGGHVTLTLYSGAYMSANSNYYRGHTLSPGSYDMLITVSINGKTATAKDIKFSVS